MKRDPVCLMFVDEREAQFRYDYQGETYCFCAEECKEKFSKNPNEFLTRHGKLIEDCPPETKTRSSERVESLETGDEKNEK